MGCRLCGDERAVFCRCDWICDGMSAVSDERGKAMIETLSLGLVTVALLVYLVYALLRPEKF